MGQVSRTRERSGLNSRLELKPPPVHAGKTSPVGLEWLVVALDVARTTEAS